MDLGSRRGEMGSSPVSSERCQARPRKKGQHLRAKGDVPLAGSQMTRKKISLNYFSCLGWDLFSWLLVSLPFYYVQCTTEANKNLLRGWTHGSAWVASVRTTVQTHAWM